MKRQTSMLAFLLVLFFTTGCSLFGPDTSQTDNIVLEVGDQKVTTDEFKYVYKKNNDDEDNLYSKKSLRDYANLYTDFKLKVQAARDDGLDTLPKLERELRTYKKQLAEPYLQSDSVMQSLLNEAYDRYRQQIKARHISVRVPRGAPASDTAEARKLLSTIREEAISGMSMEKLAKQYSKRVSAGALGYFSVFDQPYKIENVAYNLNEGSLSKPIRTDFGYHLIKLIDKRPYKGKMKTKHIMVKRGKSSNNEAQGEESAQKNIDSIYQMLKSGAKFSKVARVYSDDKRSSRKGGELPAFDRTTPKFPGKFKKQAYSLQKDGAITKPFRTQYGYHILKRTGLKTPDSFEAIKPKLKKQLKQSQRYRLIKEAVAKRVKRKNNFKQYKVNWDPLEAQLDSTFKTGEWTIKNPKPLKTKLFRIGEKTYQLLDYAKYLEDKKGQELGQYQYQSYALKALYDKYRRQKILDYERQHLKSNHPEFRHLLNEYEEGVLLFEIMDRKVWKKAVKDSAGLRAYFEDNKDQYKLPKSEVVTYYRFASPEGQQQAFQQLKAGEAHSVVKQNLRNTLQSNDWIQRHDTFTKRQQSFMKNVGKKPKVYHFKADSQYYVVDLKSTIPAKKASFKDVRGQVVADYQQHLESKWLEQLRKRYTVKLHEDVLESLAANQ